MSKQESKGIAARGANWTPPEGYVSKEAFEDLYKHGLYPMDKPKEMWKRMLEFDRMARMNQKELLIEQLYTLRSNGRQEQNCWMH